MRVRAHHLQCFFFGLLALVGLQIALFDKIFECAGDVEGGTPLRFRNIHRRQPMEIIDQDAAEDSVDEDFEAASGCILVCDDNHFLIGTLIIMHSCSFSEII